MKTINAAIILADGFEEIEAVTVIDVLRRAGIATTVTGLTSDRLVTGSHELRLVPETALSDLVTESLDLLVLPGGMPGSRHLADSVLLRDLIQTMNDANKWLAAICAAPIALQAAGVLRGRKATSYPSVKELLTDCLYTSAAVECDGNIITSRGVGTALPFALLLVEKLLDRNKADELARAMLVQ